MTYNNFTLSSEIVQGLEVSNSLNVSDVVRDVCVQIDNQIIFSVLMIFSFWVFRFIVFSGARDVFEEYVKEYNKDFSVVFSKLFDSVASFLETGALISSSYLLYLVYLQGLITIKYWVWIGFLGFLLLCQVYIFLMELWRSKIGKK